MITHNINNTTPPNDKNILNISTKGYSCEIFLPSTSTPIATITAHLTAIIIIIRFQIQTMIITIIFGILLISTAQLLTLLLGQTTLDKTSHVRFMFLVGIHALVMTSMLVCLRIQGMYGAVVLVLVDCVVIIVACFVCQLEVWKMVESGSYVADAQVGSTLQLTYLNIYFVVYLYGLVCLIPSLMFIIVTQVMICHQENIINTYRQRCIQSIQFKQDMEGQICSICLLDFDNSGPSLLKVKSCGHVFHAVCLDQWMRYNTICPLDRSNIFNIDALQQ